MIALLYELVNVSLTLHQHSFGPADVVEVSAVRVTQTVVPQVMSVAQTLQNGVHETLQRNICKKGE